MIFPARCPICDDVLYEKNKIDRPLVCPECFKKITFIEQPFCFKCGKPLDDSSREYCNDCVEKDHFFTRGFAAFAYSEAMKASMYGFKYNNRREYGKYYAKAIVARYGALIRQWDADVIIPVPLHKRKEKSRGYNQAEVLAMELSKELGIFFDNKILERVRYTVPQKELKDKERIKNIKNAFQIRKNGLEYSKIVLVDDIYTTGTTIDECAKVLIQAGASQVYFLTACVGKGF